MSIRCFDDGDFGAYVSNNDFESMTTEDVKSFMQQLSNFLIKDLDKKNQKDILNVVQIINQHHTAATQNSLKLSLMTLGKVLITAHSHVSGNSGFGMSSLFAINILIKVLKSIPFVENHDDVKNLLQFVVLLPSGCFLSGRKKIVRKCKDVVTSFLTECPQFHDKLSAIVAAGECKPHFLAFVVIAAQSKCALLSEESMINYTKLCFSDKQQIPKEIVDRIGALLQRCVNNRASFEENILPLMTKLALRAPEKALWVINSVLTQMGHLDMSQSNHELIKVLLTQLQSKNDSLRSLARDCLLAVVVLISAKDAVENALDLILSLLIGSEKVAHLETRLAIFATLTTIPTRVSLGSASAKASLSQFVISRLAPSVVKETQEPVILATLECVSVWSRLDQDRISPALPVLFHNNAYNPKNTTSVKVAYFTCLNECFDRTQKLTTLIPDRLQDVLDRLTKTGMLTAGIHEVLPIVDVLLRFCTDTDNVVDSDPMKTTTIPGLIFTACGFKTSVANARMFSDQSLTAASPKTLVSLMTISRYLLIHYYDILVKLPDHMALIFRALVVCCLHDNYQTVRKHALNVMTQLSRSTNGPAIVNSILDHLQSQNLCDSQNLLSFWFWPIDNGGETISPYDADSLRPLAQRIAQLVDSLLDLDLGHKSLPGSKSKCEPKYPHCWDSVTRIKTMHRALLPLNQNMISTFYPNLWSVHTQKLVGSTDSIVEFAKEDIISRLVSVDLLDKNDVAVLKCLCLNFSAPIIEQLLHAVINELDKDNLVLCSENEVGIMNTREGYLFNKTLLDSLPKYESNKSNIKRENKLYSYKDQMAGIEIKREQDDKKKKVVQENKVESDNPIEVLSSQLTKNHMEQISKELAKEKHIRQRMKEMEKKVTVMTEIFRQISVLRKDCFLKCFDSIIKVLQKLIMKSPVGRMQASVLFNDLHSITSLTKKQSIWILRVLFFDSLLFNDDVKENWKYNVVGQGLMHQLEILGQEELADYSVDCIDKMHKNHWTFSTFLYALPALCQLCQSIADMESLDSEEKGEQWWTHLIWMDIGLLTKIINVVKNQIFNGQIDRRQLFNSDLLQVLMKVTQSTEIHDVHQLVDETVLKMMEMFSINLNDVELSKTHVFETVLKCFVCNTIEARQLALNCIDVVEGIENGDEKRLSMYIWMARHDAHESVATKATELWNKLNLSVNEELVIELMEFVISQYDQVRTGSIRALSELIEIFSGHLSPLIAHIFILYDELAYVKPPVCDDFGRVLIPSPADRWVSRLGLGKALISLSKYISDESLALDLFNFFIPRALNDRNPNVRASMLEAGQNVIEYFGKDHISMLLPILENYLNTAPNIASNDIVRQSVVILMGSLAKHLDASDERFNSIFGKLIEALNFPSEDVQRSVSDTFDPLIKAFSEEKQNEIATCLLTVLFNSKEVAERKGAAFGIAGIVKAVGITKLKTFKINDTLLQGIQNKNSEVEREISLFTYEQISAKMGKKFEPYVPQLLKYLLDTFADPSSRVRETALRTARILMSNLSAPGVKIVLNPLLSGLDTNQWRTKSVSVELLGSMAYCAPKQLSNCLPTIVPKIISILSDSHQNVIKSARQALREIGSVIQNKEIEVIVPVLIDALCDPIRKTDEGLDCLIGTKFVHQVDAASLAIIMSMVSRAFKERRSETKRKAAQIIANLQSLIDDKDLEPYCANLMPGLKGCLVDPDPGVREVASIALGTIAKVMEPATYEELMIWLMEALKDEASGVNRSGAAQGLSEVLLQKGVLHLDKFMPDILENTRNTKLLAHVRDGYLMLYIYLPKRFKDQFARYVKEILPSILQALSDEVEYIRETALNAGQGIIEIYSHIAIDTMLPNLESGMLDSNWRIRYSSIKLLGELLFRLTGISGKGTTVGGNDDESFAQTSSQAVIEASIGSDKYRHVLAEIFMARMDVSLQVKQAAVHIWKLMVVNTARCLRMIMSDLMVLVLDCLSGDDNDNRIMATKSLGDVVKKLGERSLPDIFHDLESGFENCQPNQRIGVCNAILEILKACPKEQIVNYLDKVLPTFKSCLCDDNADVRKIAGEIFELLHSSLGVRIVDIVIPDLVDKLDDPVESENALNGLCTLVHLKGRFVIPSLIPRLTYPTVNTKAFSELAKVAGDILSRHIVTVLPALLQAVKNVVDCANEAEEVDHCCQVIMAMDDAQTTQIILKELTTAISNGASVNEQIAGLRIMSSYMRSSAEDDFIQSNKVLMNYVPIVIRTVVKLFAADNKPLLLAAFDCLTDLINSLGSSNIEYVKDVRDAILVVIRDMCAKTGAASDDVLVPAFCLEERAIGPLIELYREALVNGRAELKEVAASGMEDCISATETRVLAKAAVKISGPLIRTMSERHNAATKAAIVSSLGKLVAKCPTQVKLFATQMQTIFIKSLADPSQQLRHRAGVAQACLAKIIVKPDQFFQELVARELSDDSQYRDTGLEAARLSLEMAGDRLSQDTLAGLVTALTDTLADRDDQVRVCGSACLAVAMSLLTEQSFERHLSSMLAAARGGSSVLGVHGLMVCLMVLCKRCCTRMVRVDAVVTAVSEHCASDKVFIATTAYRVVGFMAQHVIAVSGGAHEALLAQLLALLSQGMKQQSLELKDVVVDVCGYLCWTDREGANVSLYSKTALAILINGYRAKENALRVKSERRIMDLVRLSVNLRRSCATEPATVDETVYKMCCDSLEQGTKAALAEVVNRFRKTYMVGTMKEPPTHCPELDNSYIKFSCTE